MAAAVSPIKTILTLSPRDIVIDEMVMSRVRVDMDVIRNYADAMERGEEFPPITVFYDLQRDERVLAAGFHRLPAHRRAKPNDPIKAEQVLGTREDARWFSIADNQRHGLQRTNEDKHKATRIALLHPKGQEMSDRNIAKYVGVSHTTVKNIRKELEKKGYLEKAVFRRGADGRLYNVTKIGKHVIESSTCSDCAHYNELDCMIEGETREPDHRACEEFYPAPPPEPEKEEKEDAYDPRSELEYIPKEVRHRVSRRKPGVYIEVPLSRTNIDLAAVEIRHFFGDSYCLALGQALLKLIRESRE